MRRANISRDEAILNKLGAHIRSAEGVRHGAMMSGQSAKCRWLACAGGVRPSLYRIYIFVIAVIIYGSLYPWDFHSAQFAGSPLWVLIHSWPTAIDRFLIRDVAVNVLIYMPAGVFGFLALRQNFRPTFAITMTVLVGLVLSSGIEMTQLFDDARECSLSDVVFNVGGTILGVSLGYVYQNWLKRFLARADTTELLHPPGAVLLFYTWLAYQLFPLFPTLSRTRLVEQFSTLYAAVSLSPLATFTYFVEWMVIAELVETVLGTRRTRRLFPLLLLVLPAKLLIVGRTVTWSELGGSILAYICWLVLSRYQKRTAVVGGLIVSLLILSGLFPYHWSSAANPFSLIPFRGFLEADQEGGMLIFLRKCFWYGSAVWLLRVTGWRLVRAAVAVALLLGTIEVIQIHLPGRVAEITDPLLALILAAALGLLDRPQDVHISYS